MINMKSAKGRAIKHATSDRIYYAVAYTIIALLTLCVLYPLIYILSSSFSSARAVSSGKVLLWPVEFSLDGYNQVFAYKRVWVGYRNTIFYTVAGTMINLAVTLLCAYPLARKGLWGRKVLVFLFTFTMMFGGGMIPTYLVIKQLGLIDTRAVMILPGALTVWNMIMCRTYFMNSIPEELYESAALDGASDARMLVSLVLPLSTPILAVMVLFYAVGHWNAYFDAMIYLNSPELYNIQLVLRNAINNVRSITENASNDLTNMVQNEANGEAVKYVLIVITMIPVMLIYPFVQKYFIKGIMIGSIKG